MSFENFLAYTLLVTTIVVVFTRMGPRGVELMLRILLGVALAAITILMLDAMGVR